MLIVRQQTIASMCCLPYPHLPNPPPLPFAKMTQFSEEVDHTHTDTVNWIYFEATRILLVVGTSFCDIFVYILLNSLYFSCCCLRCVTYRAHDPAIGKVFYQKIRQIRDALGLSYRFEVIYDDGSTFLKISDHFSRRLAQWKSGRHLNGVSRARFGGGGRKLGCQVISYKELENLPCLVVLAGEHRAGLSFPR